MSDAAGLTDNRSILAKADLALADIIAEGGYLQPAQSQKFMRILIKEATLMKEATIIPMKSPKQLTNMIGFGTRILRAGREATALAKADRAKPDMQQVELDAQLFKAEVRLSNETLEDSIERNNLRQTIMQLMAERIALDMEEVVVNGDVLSSDPFLAQFDGVLKSATSHVVDAAGVTTTKGILHKMIKSMPSEYLRNKKKLRFLTSVQAELDYRDSLSERATAMGDRFIAEDVAVAYGGIPLLDVPVMPETLGNDSNQTSIVLTDPENINIGIWRQIQIETDKLVSEGVLLIVATLRFDMKYAYEPAVVKATHVRVV